MRYLPWDRELLMLDRPFTDEEKRRNKWQTRDMGECDIQRTLFWKHRSAATIMLPNYTPNGWYESDLYVVTNAGYAVEYEIKTSLSDFRADFRKRDKHRRLASEHRSSCRPARFFYACPAMVISLRDVPSYAGLVYFNWVQEHYVTASPAKTVIKNAPRLSGEKVSRETIAAMRRSSYYRFWNERFARIDIAKDRQRPLETRNGETDGWTDQTA